MLYSDTPAHKKPSRLSKEKTGMKIKVIIHDADEGGYWAEVPGIPGCATQGETFEELLQNLYEAVEGCLNVDIAQTQTTSRDRVVELAL
jgi:predicted RNase H-like HicB family nuclease